ncbi:MAG: GreA/GreB family elongation factor [Cryobacterium sp.]|nr:GreA/GreB family elongation factor [Oligoflexia bacterium]
MPNASALDKKKVIQHLISFLEEELRDLPKNDANLVQKQELESLLVMYRFLPARDHEPTDPIVPTSLVTLQIGSATTFAFIVPRGGGFITAVDGNPLQVLTPNSPLGEALLGRKTSDRVLVEIRGQKREYVIIASS